MKKTIDVLSLIPFGHENAITRERLAKALGTSDRQTRKEIEKLRAGGQPISNFQDGAGYFIPVTKVELLTQRELNNSRAMAILMQQKYIDHRLKHFDQMEIGEVTNV